MEDTSFWRRYGLASAPFDDSARRTLYCSLPQWRNSLNGLHKLVDGFYVSGGQRGIVLIVGAFGTGKSILLAQFLNQLDADILCCSVRGNPSVGMLELSLAIAARFKLSGLVSQLKGANVETQRRLLIDGLSERSQKHLLIVDDAHRLQTETLAALLSLAHLQIARHKNCLPILLLGDLKLKSRMPGLERQDSHIAVYQLKPLDEENTKIYLTCRLKQAGWTGGLPFSAADITRVQRLSGGIPGRINRVAEQMLLQRLVEHQPYSDTPVVKTGVHDNEFIENRQKPQHLLNFLKNICHVFWVKIIACLRIGHWICRLTTLLFARRAQCFNLLIAIVIIGMLLNMQRGQFGMPKDATFARQQVKTKQLTSYLPSAHAGVKSAYFMADIPAADLESLPDLRQKTYAIAKEEVPLQQANILFSRDERYFLDNQGYVVQLIAMPHLAGATRFLRMHRLSVEYRKPRQSKRYYQRTAYDDEFLILPRIFRGVTHNRLSYAVAYGPFRTKRAAINWLRRQSDVIWNLRPWIRSLVSVQNAIWRFAKSSQARNFYRHYSFRETE